MSQIFDALHQSATEKPGNSLREVSAAKELLQVVERKAVASAVSVAAEPSPVPGDSAPQFPTVKTSLSDSSKIVCLTQSDSLAAEKFRFLATRLRHLQQKRSLKRLVITSSVTGEGKSLVAVNLACALAAGKQRVLLVEGDLRRPSLAPQLGLQDLHGLSQMLHKTDGDTNHIYRLESLQLCVLLAGDIHSSPVEFIETSSLSNLMDRISTAFDWVVIDSPPVEPLADTSIWMRMADGVLLVTRPGVTSKRQLQRSFEAIEQAKLLGTVLNASAETATNHYYHHYAGNRTGGFQVTSSTAKR
jgi:capsular exopolysaccharide synthesis family protein